MKRLMKLFYNQERFQIKNFEIPRNQKNGWKNAVNLLIKHDITWLMSKLIAFYIEIKRYRLIALFPVYFYQFISFNRVLFN